MTADSNLARCRPCSHSSRSPPSGASPSSRSRTPSSSTRSSRSWPSASRSPRSCSPSRRRTAADARAAGLGRRRVARAAARARLRAADGGARADDRLERRLHHRAVRRLHAAARARCSSGRAWAARSGSASRSRSSGSRCSPESAPAIRSATCSFSSARRPTRVQIVLMERYAPRYDPIAFTQAEMLAAFAGFAVVAVALGQLEMPHGWTVWGALLVTGIFASALAFLVQTWAQRRTSATRTALAFAMEPVLAGILRLLARRRPAGRDRLGRLRADHGRDRRRRAGGGEDAAPARRLGPEPSQGLKIAMTRANHSCGASRSWSPRGAPWVSPHEVPSSGERPEQVAR